MVWGKNSRLGTGDTREEKEKTKAREVLRLEGTRVRGAKGKRRRWQPKGLSQTVGSGWLGWTRGKRRVVPSKWPEEGVVSENRVLSETGCRTTTREARVRGRRLGLCEDRRGSRG